MKLLFENWHEYLLKEDDPSLRIIHGPQSQDSATMAAMREAERSVAYIVGQMADPTRISSWEDLKQAKVDFEQNQTKASLGWYVVALIGVIPAIGMLAAPFKAAKTAKLLKIADEGNKAIEAAATISRTLEKIKDTNNIATQIKRSGSAAQNAIEALRKATHSTRPRLRGSKPFVTVKVASNLRKLPNILKYTGTAYRGVKVSGIENLMKMLDPGGAKFATRLRKQFANLPADGKWVTINVPSHGAMVRPLPLRPGTSWTIHSDVAVKYSIWPIKTPSRARGPLTISERGKFQVVFKTQTGPASGFIDVNKTLEASGKAPKFTDIDEVLALDDVPISQMFVRIVP